jgi:glycosyltransferase A (GT-A) superfamily protein (DUF2064 family)
VIARVGGIALVAVALVAVSGRFLAGCFALGSLIWLLCLRSRPSARWVFLIALLLRAPFLFGDLHSNDLHRYVWEGRIQWEGVNPYEHAPSDPALAHLRGPNHESINHPELPAIYPPLAQLFFAASAGVGLEERGLRNLIILLDLALVLALLGWLRATGRAPGLALVYAWSPVAVAGSAVGHYEPLLLLLLVLAGRAWEQGHKRRAAALLGGAILAKTVAVLLVPWMLLRRPKEGLLFCLPLVVLGYLFYLGANPFHTLVRFGSEFAFNASLFRVAAWLTPEGARLLVGAALLAWTGWIALTQPRYAPAGSLLFAGLLLLSPTVHYWYLAWFLVLLPACGLRPWTWPLLAWCVTALFAGGTYLAVYRGGPFVEHFERTWLVYAPVGLLIAALAWRGRPRREPLFSESPRGGQPSFAVVIPCRGEHENLRTLVPAWLEAGARQVVLADTPTGDGTPRLAGDRVIYVAVARRGYGAAVLAGMEAAGGAEIAVVCDADHHRGPGQVRDLLSPLAAPRVGLVTGARTDPGALPVAQRAGNALACTLIGSGWGRRFHDLGPFRALRISAWPPGALADPGFGINVEMNVRALERGMKIVEVPLPSSRRRHGSNRISGTLRGTAGAGWGMLRTLFRLREESALPGATRATVVILTKLPGSLPVKTRLATALGEAGAREVYVEMLRRMVRLARTIVARPVLAYSPPDADPRSALPGVDGCRMRPVEGDDGAACLENALADAYEGFPLIALGGDAPDLPAERVEQAVAALRRSDAVLVPAGDGGFSLLGLREPVPGLARGFRYGSEDSVESLRAFLEAAGRRVLLLEPWPDVDTPEDLAAWRRRTTLD